MYLPVKFSYIHESTHATKAKGIFFLAWMGKVVKQIYNEQKSFLELYLRSETNL